MKYYSSFVSVLLIVVLASAMGATQRRRSTPEDRAKIVELARRLETDPLGSGRNEDRQWFRDWMKNTTVRDIPSCSKPFESDAKGKYSEELSLQFKISTVAFIIEHPEQAGDPEARLLAGIRGMMKAYRIILEKIPGSTSRFLNTLVPLQNNHQLEQSVREIMAQCSDVPMSDKNRPLPTGEKVYAPLEVEGLPYVASLSMPAYVGKAKETRTTGKVVLHVVLGADGKVSRVEVVSGLPYNLTESSIEAARRTSFEPAYLGGKPVPVMVVVEYKFEIQWE